jgi:hypothetical protein
MVMPMGKKEKLTSYIGLHVVTAAKVCYIRYQSLIARPHVDADGATRAHAHRR